MRRRSETGVYGERVLTIANVPFPARVTPLLHNMRQHTGCCPCPSFPKKEKAVTVVDAQARKNKPEIVRVKSKCHHPMDREVVCSDLVIFVKKKKRLPLHISAVVMLARCGVASPNQGKEVVE